MKTLLIIAFIIPVDFLFYQKIYDEPKYTFLTKEDEITLWYRWIAIPNHKDVRELKADFVVSATPEKIVNIIKNEKTATQWMKGVSEFRKLGITSENLWYSYMLYDIPWPLNNQDCVVQNSLQKNYSGTEYIISMKGIPQYIPEKEGITRIQHLQGTWKITRSNSKESKVIYTIYSMQAPKFPRWITDPIIQQNLIHTLSSFKHLAEGAN